MWWPSRASCLSSVVRCRRKLQVDDQQVIIIGLHNFQTLAAVWTHRPYSLRTSGSLQDVAELLFVLDDQDAHVPLPFRGPLLENSFGCRFLKNLCWGVNRVYCWKAAPIRDLGDRPAAAQGADQGNGRCRRRSGSQAPAAAPQAQCLGHNHIQEAECAIG